MGNSVFGPPAPSSTATGAAAAGRAQQEDAAAVHANVAAAVLLEQLAVVETEHSTAGSFRRDDPFFASDGEEEAEHSAGDVDAETPRRPRALSFPDPVQQQQQQRQNACASGRLTNVSSASMAASAASMAASPTGGSSGAQRSWCLVKAKTRQHNSTRVARKVMWFEAKANGDAFRIGRAQGCHLRLDDDRCAELNASLEPVPSSSSSGGGPAPGIQLNPRARMYQLVGMGSKRCAKDTVLYVGAVIKVGSVSLEVTDMCTDESDDFVERFAVEISSARRAARRASQQQQQQEQERRSVQRLRGRGDTHTAAAVAASAASNGGAASFVTGDARASPTGAAALARREAQAAAATVTASSKRGQRNGDGLGSGSGSSNNEGDSDGSVEENVSQMDAAATADATEDDEAALGEEEASDNESVDDHSNEDEDPDDAMCYICWGGQDQSTADDGDAAGSGSSQAPLGERHSHRSYDDDDEEGGETAASRQRARRRQSVLRENPLITNPCGKCSGSSRYVHLNCLLTWIKSSGSGHCSICNGPLPQHFSSPPPNLELKVVRHRRGQSWVGTRRFRLSFADRDVAVVGRDSDSDVRLPDRSVGSTHARITFNREARQFELADCNSLGGTFLQVKDAFELQPEQSMYLKIGRTLLSLRMTHKRGAFFMLQNPLSWTKR